MRDELTIDEFAERVGCSVDDVACMRKRQVVVESSRNRFLLADVPAALKSFAKMRPRAPRIDCETRVLGLLPQNEDGIRGLAAIPDPRIICRTVNTMSDRHVLTARERAFESVGLAF